MLQKSAQNRAVLEFENQPELFASHFKVLIHRPLGRLLLDCVNQNSGLKHRMHLYRRS